MIKVNYRNGHTVSYDLQRDEDFKRWQEVLEDPEQATLITGMQIHMNGVMITLPKPKARHRFGADLVTGKNGDGSGERIFSQFLDSRIDIVSFFGSKLVRVDFRKTGIQRFNPRGPIDRSRK